MKRFFFSVSTLLLLCANAVAAEKKDGIVLESGPVQKTMVQLFTSDASSNCNPALRWISNLKESGALWTQFVPIALHVRQWDGAGYKDAFSKKEFDEILNFYQKRWRTSKVYPPTVAVNGEEWSGWARGQTVPVEVNRKTGILRIDGTKRESYYEAVYQPDSSLSGETFTLHGALVGFGLKSKPADGKNRGKSLEHDFIVLQYKAAHFTFSYDVLTAGFELAKPKGIRIPKLAVIFWVTKRSDALPLQSAGSYL